MNVPEPKLDTRKERERRGERDRERPETHSYRIVFTRHRKTDTEDTHENSTGLLPPPLDSLSLSLTRSSDSPLPLQKRAIPRRAARSTTNSTSRHILLCVCVLSPHLLLSHPDSHATIRAHKKSICAHVPSARHRDPPSSSCARGHKQRDRRGAHQARGSTARPCKGRRSRTEAHTPPAAPACIPPLCARLRRGTLPAQASARRAGRADPRRSAPLAQRTATGTSTCCRAPGGRATTGVYTCRVTARTCRSSP